MPRTPLAGRSYFTYQQSVVRAFVELEQERNGGTGRPFHAQTIRAKIHHLALKEQLHLGERWARYVAKAIDFLLDHGVLCKARRHGYITLSPKARKHLADSNLYYGPFENLSSFKQSQFLKAIIIISPSSTGNSQSCPHVLPDDSAVELAKKLKRQEMLVISLRTSLRATEQTNKLISIELEKTKEERDDLELDLRDHSSTLAVRGESTTPLHSTQEVAIAVELVHSSRLEPNHQEKSPRVVLTCSTPSTEVIATNRPISAFTHCPSGSFINTISKLSTPCPSPTSMMFPIASSASDGMNGNNGDGHININSDDHGFGPANFGYTYTHLDEVDDGFGDRSAAPSDMDVDHSTAQTHGPLIKDLDLEAQISLAEKGAAALMDTRERLAAALVENNSPTIQLASITRERHTLQDGKAKLEEALRDHEQEVERLRNALATAIQEQAAVQASRTSTLKQMAVHDEARLAAESARAQLCDEVARYAGRVKGLNMHIGELTTQLQESSTQGDKARMQGSCAMSQLAITNNELQTTKDYLSATDSQLRGIQRDLCMFWNELQKAIQERDRMQDQLDISQAQLQTTRDELGATHASLDSSISRLDSATAQLQTSEKKLNATTMQLEQMQGVLQLTQAELQISKAQYNSAAALLHRRDTELEAENIALDCARIDLLQTRKELELTINALKTTKEQLNSLKAEHQDLLRETNERENSLDMTLKATTAQLDATRMEVQQVTNKAAERERRLATDLEDAQERASLAQEELEGVRSVWLKAEEKKRLAAEADEQVHQMLFASSLPKRDTSVRDSGVSFV